MITIEQARDAKKKVATTLATMGVSISGIGIGKDGDDYMVAVRVFDDAAAKQVPDAVDGVKVSVEVVGEVKAQ